MMPVNIIPMEDQHVEDVVRVHLTSFTGFFLTFLGPAFLRLLYREIIATPDHIAWIATDDNNEVIGFVAGIRWQSSFYGRLIRRRLLAFVRAAMPAFLRRPSIIWRLFRALTYSRSGASEPDSALLMSLAVLPTSSGKGVGQQLVRAFLDESRLHGASSVSLTTDRDNNERTNQFYSKLGFRLRQTYVTPEGRAMNEYLFQLEQK